MAASIRHDRLDLPAGQPGAAWFHHARRPRLPVHRHDELEANLVVAGRARLLVGDRRFPLQPGTLVWLFPSQGHQLIDPDPDFRMWIVVWNPDTVAEMGAAPAEPDPPGDWVRHLPAAEARGLARLCERVRDAEGRGPAAEAGLRWLLVRLWDAWSASPAAEPETTHPAVRRALHLLAGPEPPALAQLAEACGMSADVLARHFRRDTGTTVGAWRNRLRLERACAALLGGHDATAAALEAGFASYAGFHRAFTNAFGLPPSRWLAQARQDG